MTKGLNGFALCHCFRRSGFTIGTSLTRRRTRRRQPHLPSPKRGNCDRPPSTQRSTKALDSIDFVERLGCDVGLPATRATDNGYILNDQQRSTFSVATGHTLGYSSVSPANIADHRCRPFFESNRNTVIITVFRVLLKRATNPIPRPAVLSPCKTYFQCPSSESRCLSTIRPESTAHSTSRTPSRSASSSSSA